MKYLQWLFIGALIVGSFGAGYLVDRLTCSPCKCVACECKPCLGCNDPSGACCK